MLRIVDAPSGRPARALPRAACGRALSASSAVTAAAPPGYPPAERALPPAAPDIPPAARPPRDFPAGRAGGSTGRAAGFPPHSTGCRSIAPGRSCPPSGNSAPGIAPLPHRSSPRCKEKTSIICTSFVTQHYAYISIIGSRAPRAQLRIAGNIAGNGTLSIPTNQNNSFCKMGRFCQKYFLFCIKNGTIKTPSLKREGNGNDRKPLIPAKEISGTVTSRAGGYAVRLAPHHIRLRKREK